MQVIAILKLFGESINESLWRFLEELALLKTRASYVSRFNFGERFLDEKFVFQIANFQFFWIFAKNADFQTILRITVFHVGGYAFGF